MPASYFNPLQHLSIYEIIAIFFSLLLGDALIPPVIQRLLMSKTPKQAKYSMIFGGVGIIFICLIGGSLGMLAYALNPSIEPINAIPFLFEKILSQPLLKVIFVCGLISAIMSSMDTYLNSLSVVLVNDIIQPLFKTSTKVELYIARIAVLITGVISIVLAMKGSNILDLLLDIYKFWGPTILIPLIGVLLNKPISKKGFYICFSLGVLINILWDLSKLQEKLLISSLVPGIFASAICYFILYQYEKARGNSKTQESVYYKKQ